MATIYKRAQDKGIRRACWYIGYTDAHGKRVTVKGFTDKGETEKLASQLEEESRLIRRGLKRIPKTMEDESLAKSIEHFRDHLKHRDVSEKQIGEVTTRVRKVMEECQWQKALQISAAGIERRLGLLRDEGLSKQTSNHYLRSLKQFSRWLVRTRRLIEDPLAELRMLNVNTDRRHDRRPLSGDELNRLVEAAEEGSPVEGISGQERAMMYLLAAWTGYRKGEIGSLTAASFDFDGDPPTVTVEALYSKHKRRDTQVLYPELAIHIVTWLKQRKPAATEILFPVSRRSSGFERKTAKMMRVDLKAARDKWLAEDEEQRAEREKTDFLAYKDHRGRYADFHSNRHTFITNLSRVGVSTKTAQTLARHSDVRLTLNVYSHTELAEKRRG